MRPFITAIALTVLLSSPSFADFKYKGGKMLVHSDQAAFEQEEIPASAFAVDLPLMQSLDLIAGDRIKLDLGNDLDTTSPISWRGGRARGEILAEIFSTLDAQYWYAKGLLTVRTSREISIAKKLGIQGTDGKPTQNVIWPIPANISVKKLFTEWMKLTPHGQLSWLLQDHQDCQITIPHKITGTLQQAVMRVIETSNSRPGCSIPYARLTGNNILVVSPLLRGNYQ